MLRVHCVQLFYNLSDPGMEDLLYESDLVRRFVGLKLCGLLPDETAILNFRHLFGSTMPNVVTRSFAATYVLMISVFNKLGRFAWASFSDYLGRKNTFCCFFAIGASLYLSITFVASAVSVNPSVAWLVMFYAVAMLAFTMYGGRFATIPAYLADVFGTLNVGAIHGRLLTAWSAPGAVGPLVMTTLREFSVKQSIHNITAQVDPADFEAKFGVPLSALEELIAAKTVTISKLMVIAPVGTVDPTPGVSNLTM